MAHEVNAGRFTVGTAPKEAPPVALERIDYALADVNVASNSLGDIINHLERRLNSVMRPEGDSDNVAAPSEAKQYMSPLAYALSDHADRLHGFVGRIETILSRLET